MGQAGMAGDGQAVECIAKTGWIQRISPPVLPALTTTNPAAPIPPACLPCPAACPALLPTLPYLLLLLCLSALPACVPLQVLTELTCSSKMLPLSNHPSTPTGIKLFRWQLVTNFKNNPHKSSDLMFTESLVSILFVPFQSSTAI